MGVSDTTVAFGIPIPSTDPIFLGIVGVHVVFGVAAVIAGAGAMLSRKGLGGHFNFGTAYSWCLFVACITMGILSMMRWSADYPLFLLGALAITAAYFGRSAVRLRRRNWPRFHLAGMAASYILMLTAFYVDNGKNLPLWNELPPSALWFVPGVIGIPLTTYYLFRLPKFRL